MTTLHQKSSASMLAWLNLIVILSVIAWNYYSNTASINGNTVGSLSEEYANLFTPAGFAFSIWGLIFLGLIALGIYLIKNSGPSDSHPNMIQTICKFLIPANLLNAAWLWFWLNEYTLVTVFTIFSTLFFLIKLLLVLSDAKTPISYWIKVPVALYAGWITVASIANVSAYLAKIYVELPISDVAACVILIISAGLINVLMLRRTRSFVYVLVGVWALLAISYRHWGDLPMLSYVGVGTSLVLLGFVVKGRL